MKEKVIFVNLTKQCNVDCPKCYLDEDNRKGVDRLSYDTLKKLLNSNEIKSSEKLTIIWQGGEPTIIGKEALFKFGDLVNSSHHNVTQAMVTNLFNTPSWLKDFSTSYLNSKIETTYATGNKFNLKGDSIKYQDRFIKNLKKVTDWGLTAHINIELNKETFDSGAEKIIELSKITGAKNWEFDISINFPKFQKAPFFKNESYPILPLNISYKMFSSFINDLYLLNRDLPDNERIKSSLFLMKDGLIDKSLSFNVLKERSFLTLNSDGSVTTNPLFSDIKQTYLGNINEQSLKSILLNKKFRKRVYYELLRLKDCQGCNFLSTCQGGPSHAIVKDGSGECCGMKKFMVKENA